MDFEPSNSNKTPINPSTSANNRQVYTVSGLNRAARRILEDGLGRLWLEGEISNFSRPASGHMYFSIKDKNAQVKCALFKGHGRFVQFKPQNGQQVLVRGRLSLYEPRGDYQLIVEHMEEAGTGALQREFERLKALLSAEGLFDTLNKQVLPDTPQQIGIVTSATGAALQDVRNVLARRYPQAPLVVYPCLVQGDHAAAQIVKMLQIANQRQEVDVLLLIRGGGSLEDLWPFNEESVVRAVAASTLPIVSGVGHEIDFTLVDFAADQRAPTPSAAAELISPDKDTQLESVRQKKIQMARALVNRLKRWQYQLDNLDARLATQHPQRLLQQRIQRLDNSTDRLHAAINHLLLQHKNQQQQLFGRLQQQSPDLTLARQQHRLAQRYNELTRAIQAKISLSAQRLTQCASTLDAVSPLRTLQRGYAVIHAAGDSQPLTEAEKVNQGDLIKAQLAKGVLHCRIEQIEVPPVDDETNHTEL